MSYSTRQLERLTYLVRDLWLVPDHRESHHNYYRALGEVESASELHQYAAHYHRGGGPGHLAFERVGEVHQAHGRRLKPGHIADWFDKEKTAKIVKDWA